MYEVNKGYKITYNGVNGAANAMKSGMKLGFFSKIFAGLGTLLSAGEIVITIKD